jgi:hypothetical protein
MLFRNFLKGFHVLFQEFSYKLLMKDCLKRASIPKRFETHSPWLGVWRKIYPHVVALVPHAADFYSSTGIECATQDFFDEY